MIELKKPTRETAIRFRDEITPKIWDITGKVTLASIIGAWEILYSFVKFWAYPFAKAAVAFYKEVLIPFWKHVKVFWARLSYKLKGVNWKFWTRFKKDEPIDDVPEPEPIDPLFQ